MEIIKIKMIADTLNEELKYHESINSHKKSLEATLWGLQEQASFPENSSVEDQTEFKENINTCQMKILNCDKLIKSHLQKLTTIIKEFGGE